jgi:5'-3' exonuclease
MGIPSYFGFILKNYNYVIKPTKPAKINHLYMDCNSIIYDIIAEMKENKSHNKIISNVIKKIEEYIILIKPSSSIYIAFDGIAPFAKLDQQRERRYKSWFNSLSNIAPEENKFDTNQITPGTLFMKILNKSIKSHFASNSKKIFISTTDECGEGEHKIFQHMRDTKYCADDVVCVFGLDSDLIMLSINHLKYCPQIYLFRNALPDGKNANVNSSKNEFTFLNIAQFAQVHPISPNDYIFLCFFLGNDFMPHFPSLNIRTNGILKLLDNYNRNEPLTTQNNTILWHNLRKFLQRLKNYEMEYYIKEHLDRDKFYGSQIEEKGSFDKNDINNAPVIHRSVELFINPCNNNGFKERYYKALFGFNDKKQITNVCINYLEGLEWTFKYYSIGCPDWNWKYNYNYPPLLADLFYNISALSSSVNIKTGFINPSAEKTSTINEIQQLIYVLPRGSLHFLPEDIQQIIDEKYCDYYPINAEFIWAYKRFLWESSVKLPEISNELLNIGTPPAKQA